MALELRPTYIYKRPDGSEAEHEHRWIEYRRDLPLLAPYVYRGARSRFARQTRERVEAALALNPD